jgi:hypothetical protein
VTWHIGDPITDFSPPKTSQGGAPDKEQTGWSHEDCSPSGCNGSSFHHDD